MSNFVLALVIVAGGLWLIRQMARTPPSRMRNLMRTIGAYALMAFAGLLSIRGHISAGIPLFFVGLAMLGISSPHMQNLPWPLGPRQTGAGNIATAMLSVQIDPAGGPLNGTVTNGPFRGRSLSSLALGELRQLHVQCAAAPDQSLQLLEAWLDRHRAGWRTASSSGAASPRSGMTRDEALAVLGLKAGAGEAEIKAAHRRLLKDFHPDTGGTDYIAAKINQAKDVLLG